MWPSNHRQQPNNHNNNCKCAHDVSPRDNPNSYVERPGLQDLSLVEQGMTVRSYVRPVKRRLAAGHDDIRGSNRPINFSRSKRSESGGLIATGNDVIRGSSRFAPCLLGSFLLPPESS